MDAAVALLIWACIVLGSMLVVSFLAQRWGRDVFGWLLLAAALGPIAIIAMIGARQRDVAHPQAFERRGPPPSREAQKVVLAACDGSAESERVARYLADHHEKSDEVVVLTVFPVEARPGPDGGGREEHEREIERCTRGTLDILKGAGLNARLLVGYGKPAEEILRASEEEKADVIAVGRRGAGLTKALLGSTSDYVVKHAKRPVIVVD